MSLIALANGCQVLCVEPNKNLLGYVHRSILANTFNGSAVLLQAAASHEWHDVWMVYGNQPSLGKVQEVDGIHAQAVALPLGPFLHGDAVHSDIIARCDSLMLTTRVITPPADVEGGRGNARERARPWAERVDEVAQLATPPDRIEARSTRHPLSVSPGQTPVCVKQHALVHACSDGLVPGYGDSRGAKASRS
eukprot:2325894-Rhodomonas_salina.1